MSPSDKTPPDNPDVPLIAPGDHGPPMDLDYELVRLIGKGGYGEVWLVRDKQGEYRACKVVYRESFNHDRPYEREYEGIRKFEPVSYASDSQVKILYVGRRDASGYFFYIMELADDVGGEEVIQPDKYAPKTLRSELESKGRLPADECIQIGLSLSEALENLHQHGLIHRDIKPANIIFVKGVPKLADIGLVTEADVTVSYVGTGGFIPPEGPSSPQADVYGLGKVLYEISTGKDRLEYPELPVNFGDLPDRATLVEFNSVVAKACEADARKRYASASELHADLKLLQSGKSIRQIRSSKKRWTLAAQIAAILGVIALLVMGAIYYPWKQAGKDETLPSKSPVSQIPPPDATRLAKSVAKIMEEYQQQLAAGTSGTKQQAAYALIEQSGTTEDPAVQLASLHVAALLATGAGNYSLAMQICDRMSERFRMSSLPVKADLIAQASGTVRIAAKKTELARLCVKTGFEALGADDYDAGMKLAELAKFSAKNASDSRLVKDAAFLDQEMTRCRDGYERVKRFEDVLRSQPGEPEACLAVGKFLCFVKNDWETGLSIMAHGSNETLKTVLATETNAEPKTPEEQIALGNSWRELAGSANDEDKIHYQQRARYWYLKAIATAEEADKNQLQQQLNEWIQAAPTEPGEIHIISRTQGTETIDIYGNEIRWRSTHGAMNNKINQAIVGDLKTGDLKMVKNSEATRFLPDAVDFSTARLINVRKSKKQAQTKLKIAADHVEVTLIHPRSGFAELEVTVVFGNQP